MNSTARVAIVDDDASVRRALARLLGVFSFVVDTYGSAREFIEALQSRVPGCLIVDLQMPDMTGLDLQRHLTQAGYHIPTIVITAHNQSGFREQCRAAGAAAYLIKPLHEDELIAAINAATRPSPDRGTRPL
jgi:FixJ family two-component response regulator